LLDVLGNFADGVVLAMISDVVGMFGMVVVGSVVIELVEVELPAGELEGSVVPPLLRYAGGGTAPDRLTRLPVPQGIA
jgi:hypothetical protein